jgi:AcrR family transcriptional regulator
MMPRSKAASEQVRAASRAQILDAAGRVFAARGYFDAKVADIAREAGMSQGSVYWYFASKQDVLKAVLADGFEAVERPLRETAALEGSGREKLEHLIGQYIGLGRERAAFFTVFLSLLGHGGTPFLRGLGFDTLQIGQRYHQHLSAILQQARGEGTVADVETNLLAVFFFSFFNGLMLTYADDWTKLPPELIRDTVMRMLGAGGEQPCALNRDH